VNIQQRFDFDRRMKIIMAIFLTGMLR